MTQIPESELIINSDGSVFHLHLFPEDIADTIFLFGDPGRVEQFAQYLDKVELARESREFKTITGEKYGHRITGISTGIGTDNIDIVVTELDALANIDFKTRMPKEKHRRLTLLRIGTCGATSPSIPLGSYVFSQISIGFDGLLNWYHDGEVIRMKRIEDAFVEHMNWPERLARPYFVQANQRIIDAFKDWTVAGMTVSAPGFYGPQGRSVRLDLTIPDLIEKLESFEFEGHRITNIEMESSALAGLATILGHDAGTVCLAVANRHIHNSDPDYRPLMEGLLSKSIYQLTMKER